MVVEDEPDIYELLLAMFEMWGIDGVAFVDGEEAIAWIEEADKAAPAEAPELALLDIRLPGNITGPMVGERIRKSPLLRNMAVVLITAFKLREDEKKAVIEQAGADILLSKPLPGHAELKKILETTIAGRREKPAAKPAAKTTKKATTTKSPKKVK
jgi:CheY-like chemotaxis protein